MRLATGSASYMSQRTFAGIVAAGLESPAHLPFAAPILAHFLKIRAECWLPCQLNVRPQQVKTSKSSHSRCGHPKHITTQPTHTHTAWRGQWPVASGQPQPQGQATGKVGDPVEEKTQSKKKKRPILASPMRASNSVTDHTRREQSLERIKMSNQCKRRHMRARFCCFRSKFSTAWLRLHVKRSNLVLSLLRHSPDHLPFLTRDGSPRGQIYHEVMEHCTRTFDRNLKALCKPCMPHALPADCCAWRKRLRRRRCVPSSAEGRFPRGFTQPPGNPIS